LFDFSKGDTALQIFRWRRSSERQSCGPVDVIDFKDQDGTTQQEQLLKKIEQPRVKSRFYSAFQFGRYSLLNAVLVSLSEQRDIVLFLNAHHLVVDGWSRRIMLRTWSKRLLQDFWLNWRRFLCHTLGLLSN